MNDQFKQAVADAGTLSAVARLIDGGNRAQRRGAARKMRKGDFSQVKVIDAKEKLAPSPPSFCEDWDAPGMEKYDDIGETNEQG